MITIFFLNLKFLYIVKNMNFLKMKKHVATTINEFLYETVKNTKIIYHFTESLDSLYSILYDNALISGSHKRNRYGKEYDNISFTWNPNLWDIEYAGDLDDRYKIRISFDYDKMKKKWDFKPFDYGIPEEMEEIVETDEMNNITEYITEILISSTESKTEIINLKIDYPKLKIKTKNRKNKYSN